MRDAAVQQPETRKLILERAERVFRQFGFARTRMGDIATECGMSPANLYRFFESKADLSHAITHEILARQLAQASAIVEQVVPASVRLRDLLQTAHRFAIEQYLDESRVHDMVTRAMDEQWPVIQRHIENMRGLYRTLLEQGMQGGEFRKGDLEMTTGCVFNAIMPFCHPQLVSEQFLQDDGRQAADMADFLLRALSASGTRS